MAGVDVIQVSVPAIRELADRLHDEGDRRPVLAAPAGPGRSADRRRRRRAGAVRQPARAGRAPPGGRRGGRRAARLCSAGDGRAARSPPPSRRSSPRSSGSTSWPPTSSPRSSTGTSTRTGPWPTTPSPTGCSPARGRPSLVGPGPLVVGPDLARGVPSDATTRAGRALALQLVGVFLARLHGVPPGRLLVGALPHWLLEERGPTAARDRPGRRPARGPARTTRSRSRSRRPARGRRSPGRRSSPRPLPLAGPSGLIVRATRGEAMAEVVAGDPRRGGRRPRGVRLARSAPAARPGPDDGPRRRSPPRSPRSSGSPAAAGRRSSASRSGRPAAAGSAPMPSSSGPRRSTRWRPGMARSGMTTIDPLGYGATSFWLETCDDDLTPRPSLRRLGRRRRRDPGRRLHRPVDGLRAPPPRPEPEGHRPRARDRRVRRIRAGTAAGARPGCRSRRPTSSGGSGGPAMTRDRGRRRQRRRRDRPGLREEGIDADYVKGGSLVVARGPSQVPAMDAHWEALGRGRPGRPLRAARRRGGRRAGPGRGRARRDLRDRSTRRCTRASSSAGWPGRSSVAGGTIHERTAVVDVEPGAGDGQLRPALRTQRGRAPGRHRRARRRGLPDRAPAVAPRRSCRRTR